MLLHLPHRLFPYLLTGLVGIGFAILAIHPYDRHDWILENVLVVLFVGFLFPTYRRLTLSRICCFLIHVFLSLHLIGAHYYSHHKMSTSMIHELIEWGAAVVFAGELGQAFLDTQGDVWDAHKDMALASSGALLAMLITATLNYSVQRDFAAEWVESLRVKDPRPLGEDELARLCARR